MKFLNHLTFGQFVPAPSIIHRLDPRCKILGTMLLLTGIFLIKHPMAFGVWALLLLVMTFFSKLPFSLVLRSVKPVMILVVFTALIHLFFTKGTPVFQWGIISITAEGIRMGAYMGLRLLFLVLFACFLTLTTSPMELSDGLEKLFSPLAPLGFPAHELAMMMTIALRFIPTLLDETDRIMKAQLARGANLDKGNLWQRLRAMLPVLVPLFVIVFQRADDLATAMEARCYRGGDGRTRFKPLCWKMRDSAALIVLILTIGLLIYIDRRVIVL
ncbi:MULTISPECIES: energy-coupling factor transporter transmembrane component T family protein [Aminobacterium]|uniref:energy-coupling factor transporter transmembrane component T family protein n=1 Tax=Aminobacterium TaxID=81466 RepID=UPI00257B9BCD|nr:energy-coupling factor transporter transmembrane component T [Aminobacterium sp. UBA4834]